MVRALIVGKYFLLVVLGAIAVFLQGCFSSSTPLSLLPSRSINTWLLGVWEYTDTHGNSYQAGVFPLSDTHYSIELRPLSGPSKHLGTQYFKSYISRVDSMYFLNLFPREPARSQGNLVFFLHYQLQSPIELIITPISLSVVGHPTPWQLRQQIRVLRDAGTLLPRNKSTFWKKTSEVYWQQNAFLESQPNQELRIPIYDRTIPSQEGALEIGTTKGYRNNQ